MKIYALRLKDKVELKESSSGGAFTAFSDVFLEEGNAIVSAVYNYQSNQMEFKLYTTKEERNKARGSKYIQAYPMNSFNEAESWIKKYNKKVLFIGTGCQAEGFRKYAEIKKFRDKTLIIDIICHGTPSPNVWKKYLNKNIEYITFKDKRNGWRRPTAYVLYKGKEELITDYVSLFYKGYALRPSCYRCSFATIHRNVDITIGDFWGIEKVMPDFFSEEGNSLIFIHTERGKEVFESIKDKVEWKESNEDDCIQPNLLGPTEKPLNREKFWNDFKKKNIMYIIKKYNEASFLSKIKRKLNSLVHKI
mgnify:CR=1 FL=1